MKRDYGFSDISSGLLRIMMIPALLLGAAAARAGTLTHEVQIDLSEIRGTVIEAEGESFTKFEPKKYSVTHEVGLPMLPVVYLKLAVPTYASNFRVSTESQPMAVQKIADRIYPVQQPRLSNFEQETIFTYPDSVFYSKNEWTPVVKYVENGFLEGNQQLVTVAVYPVIYNPGLQQISIYSSISVNLQYDVVTVNEMGIKPLQSNMDFHLNDYWNIADNKIAYDEKNVQKNIKSTNNQVKRYYIITPKNLISPFEKLAQWKRQKGYIVKLVAIEDIVSDPLFATGDSLSDLADDAASLRSYLRNEFTKYGPYYALLGGDYTNMPVFRVKTRIETCSYDSSFNPPRKRVDNRHLTPTDLYFSDFQSRWTMNSDGEYSIIDGNFHKNDIDFYPEIYVGRILCTEKKHVDNYIEKLIKYESNPGNGDYEYLGRGYFTAHYEMIDQASEVKSLYEELGIFDSSTSFFRYDNRDHFPKGIDVINDMKNRYGYFSWEGHGSPSRISVSTFTIPEVNIIDSHYISSNDETTYWSDRQHILTGINRIENEEYPAVAYTTACDTEPFDLFITSDNAFRNLRMCDSFTIQGLYGGPAYLGNTRVGYVYWSHHLEKEFAKAILQFPNIGIAEAVSKANFKLKDHLRITHNLVGEPEFQMWTAVPSEFEDLSVYTENENLYINSSDLSNSNIALTDGNIQSISYNIEENNAFLLKSPIKNPIVSIWKRNYIPVTLWNPSSESVYNCTKNMIVNSSELGIKTPKKDSDYYRIESNSVINMEVLEKCSLNQGLQIGEHGSLNIISKKGVNAEGTLVKKDGCLEISASGVVFNQGFSVEKGGILDISINN